MSHHHWHGGWNVLAVAKQHFTKGKLSQGIALLCPHPKPLLCLHVISRNTLCVAIHVAEVGLGLGIALLCRHPIPLHRLHVILRNALAVGIHEAKRRLGECIATLCLRA